MVDISVVVLTYNADLAELKRTLRSVMLQEGDSEGIAALGASTGNSETFFGKNQTSSLQGKMALITKISAGLFVVLAIVIMIVS